MKVIIKKGKFIIDGQNNTEIHVKPPITIEDIITVESDDPNIKKEDFTLTGITVKGRAVLEIQANKEVL